MRIAEYSLHIYRLPYSRAVRWSDLVEDAGVFALLRLVSDSGKVGVAEMVVKPSWMGMGLRGLSAALEDVLIPLVAAADVGDADAVCRRMKGIPENHAAKALIDNALHDLRAALAGVPLWRQWNGQPSVPLSFTVTRDTPGRMAADAARMVDQYGFHTLKFKGGQGLEADVAAVRAMRSAVGDGIAFYVDANGAYAREEAAGIVAGLHDAGALVVEDPCQLSPDAGFTALQRGAPCPVLVDFGCWSACDTGLFIAAGARAFSLKPGRFGLTTTRSMAALALEADCTTVVGMFGESALGTWNALTLASTLGTRALPAEVTWFLAMQQQVISDLPQIASGCVRMSDTASIAEMVDWERVRRLSVQPPIVGTCP